MYRQSRDSHRKRKQSIHRVASPSRRIASSPVPTRAPCWMRAPKTLATRSRPCTAHPRDDATMPTHRVRHESSQRNLYSRLGAFNVPHLCVLIRRRVAKRRVRPASGRVSRGALHVRLFNNETACARRVRRRDANDAADDARQRATAGTRPRRGGGDGLFNRVFGVGGGRETRGTRRRTRTSMDTRGWSVGAESTDACASSGSARGLDDARRGDGSGGDRGRGR